MALRGTPEPYLFCTQTRGPPAGASGPPQPFRSEGRPKSQPSSEHPGLGTASTPVHKRSHAGAPCGHALSIPFAHTSHTLAYTHPLPGAARMSPNELRGSSQPHPPRAVLREAAAAQLWGLSGREEPSGDSSGRQAGGGLSCILGSGPPSHLWGQQAGPGRAAVYLCSSPPSPTALAQQQ